MMKLQKYSTLFLVIFFCIIFFILGYITLFSSGDMSDEGLVMAQAESILRGEKPWRDFFPWIMPGTEYLLATVWRIFGKSYFLVRLLTFFIAGTVTLALYKVSRRFLSRSLAMLNVLIFVYALLPFHLILSFHWIVLFFILLALDLFLSYLNNNGNRRLLLIGLFLGFGFFFMQVKALVALAAIMLWLIWRDWRKSSYILTGFLFPVGIFLIFFWQELPVFFQNVFLNNFSKYPTVNYLPLLQNWLFFLHSLIYLVILTLLWHYRLLRRRDISVLTILSIFLFFSTLYRFDLNHISYIYSLTTILILFLLQQAWRLKSTNFHFAISLLCFLPLIVNTIRSPFIYYLTHDEWKPLSTAIGKVYLPKNVFIPTQNVLDAINPVNNQYIFVYPFSPQYYVFSDKFNPTGVYEAYDGYISEFELEKIKNRLAAQNVSTIFYVPRNNIPTDERLTTWLKKNYPIEQKIDYYPSTSPRSFIIRHKQL